MSNDSAQSNSEISNQSGGVGLTANDVFVGQDMVGGNKVVVNEGGPVAHTAVIGIVTVAVAAILIIALLVSSRLQAPTIGPQTDTPVPAFTSTPTLTPTPTMTPTPTPVTVVIDDMEESSIPYWHSDTDRQKISRLDLGSVPGRTGNAMEISYTLDMGGYVLTSKRIDPQILSGTERIGFFYKADGPSNILELKLEYQGDAYPIFAVSQPLVSDTDNWVLFEMPYSAFKCEAHCPSSGKMIDLIQVARITIAVSNWRGGAPGPGKVTIDDLHVIK